MVLADIRVKEKKRKYEIRPPSLKKKNDNGNRGFLISFIDANTTHSYITTTSTTSNLQPLILVPSFILQIRRRGSMTRYDLKLHPLIASR